MGARVGLRLDDGRLIQLDAQSNSAGVLDVHTLFASGRLEQAHIAKLEGLLVELAAKIPGGAPRSLKTLNYLKRRASEAFEEEEPPTARQRSVAPMPRANGHAYAEEANSPTGAAAGSESWHPGEFEEQCKEILDHLWPQFGEHIIYFDHPVEINFVPDYYKVVRRENARDLGTIKNKLNRRRYKSPQDFHDDVRLFFNNIYLYNGAASNFGLMGKRIEESFLERWNASGLGGSNTRARRATAGIAAPKYEPAPPEKRPSLGRAASAKSVGAAASRPARQSSQRAQSGGGVAAAAAAATQPRQARGRGTMPRSQMEAVANSLSALESGQLEAAIAIIREDLKLPDGNEIELDMDSLGQGTLWRLNDYLTSIGKGVNTDNTFQVVDSDSDEGSDSDSEDDD